MSWTPPETIDYTASGDTVYEGVDKLNDNQTAIYTLLNYYGDNLVPYDQYASIAAAIAAIGSTPTTLFLNDAVTLAGDVEFVSTLDVWMGPAGSIDTNGHALTISGGFFAGPHAVFTGSTGSIVPPPDMLVHSTWFSNLGQMITLLSTNPATVLIDAPFTTTESLSFPATLTLTWLCANNEITIGDAGHTLAIAGPIIAGAFQIIDNTATGTVTVLGYPYNAAWIGSASTSQHAGFTLYTADAHQLVLQSASSELTLSGSYTDWTNAIPAGSLLMGVYAKVTQKITSAMGTSWAIGTTGDSDKWGTGLAFTLGTESGYANYAFDSLTPVIAQTATTIRIDCNLTNTFTGGKVLITIFYYSMSA